jgi:hypothetical protein
VVTAASNRSTRRGKTVSVYVCVYVCAHWGCSLVIADRKVGFALCRTKERKKGRGCIGSCSCAGNQQGFAMALTW